MVKYLLTRTTASAAMVCVAIGETELWQLIVANLLFYICLSLLCNTKTLLKFITISMVMIIPLLLVHGVVNPTYPVTYLFFGIPFRTTGFEFAADISARLSLVFSLLGFWQGMPKIFWISLVSNLKTRPSWSILLLQILTLTELFSLKIARIRLSQKSRGILSTDMNILQRISTVAAVIVPLMTSTLIDSHERAELYFRMGIGDYPLFKQHPLPTTTVTDITYSLVLCAITSCGLLF